MNILVLILIYRYYVHTVVVANSILIIYCVQLMNEYERGNIGTVSKNVCFTAHSKH